MYDMYQVLVNCIIAALFSACLTPLVKRLSFKVGAVDEPNKRRVNKQAMPSMGGLAIFISFFFSILVLQPVHISVSLPLFISALIVVITGMIDDIREITPKMKMLGLIIASILVIYFNDLVISKIDIPLIGDIQIPFIIGFIITLFWIIGITNSVNLIDGLDGLASGVSIIALTTIGITGIFFLNSNSYMVGILIFTLVSAIIGFIPFNFYPASIYLGDTGALFLGFMISVFSLYGLKNVTFITVIIPIVILGIPITDTFYAIIRRKLNKVPVSSADKNHLHHRLLQLGFTHRQTVLLIYAVAAIFSLVALLYPLSTWLGVVLITAALLIGLEIFVEIIGLVGNERQPLLKQFRKLTKKTNPSNKDKTDKEDRKKDNI